MWSGIRGERIYDNIKARGQECVVKAFKITGKCVVRNVLAIQWAIDTAYNVISHIS